MKVYRDALRSTTTSTPRRRPPCCSPSVTLALSALVLRRAAEARVPGGAMSTSSAYDVGAPGLADVTSRSPVRRRAATSSCRRSCSLAGALYCLLPVLWVFIARHQDARRAVHHVHVLCRASAAGWSRTSPTCSAYEDGQLLALGAQQPALRRGRRGAVGGRLGAGRLRAGQVPLPRARTRSSTCCSPACWCRDHPRHPAVPAALQGRARRHVLVGPAAEHHQPVRDLPVPRSTPPRSVPTTCSRRAASTAPGSAAVPLGRAADDGAGAGDRVPAAVRGDLEQLPAALHHALRRRHVPADRRACTRCSTKAPSSRRSTRW